MRIELQSELTLFKSKMHQMSKSKTKYWQEKLQKCFHLTDFSGSMQFSHSSGVICGRCLDWLPPLDANSPSPPCHIHLAIRAFRFWRHGQSKVEQVHFEAVSDTDCAPLTLRLSLNLCLHLCLCGSCTQSPSLGLKLQLQRRLSDC